MKSKVSPALQARRAQCRLDYDEEMDKRKDWEEALAAHRSCEAALPRRAIDGQGAATAQVILEAHAVQIKGHRQWWHQAAVPPTVRLLMRSVGWPTPTGTPWPALPQVPMPGSRAMSLPTMVICFKASAYPFSIRCSLSSVSSSTGHTSLPSPS